MKTYDRTWLIDSDSVIFDWDTHFRDRTEHLADRLPADYHDRPIFGLFVGVDADVVPDLMAVLDRPGFYADLKPIDGAVDALNEMLDLGINTLIATSPWLSNPTCASDKHHSFDKHIGRGWSDRAIITKDKTVLRAELIVDDKPHIEGSQVPEWEHVYFTQRYNAMLPGRRLDRWEGWQDTLLAPSLLSLNG